MNDNPGREPEKPELTPDDEELDDDLLLHAELDTADDEIPNFLTENEEAEDQDLEDVELAAAIDLEDSHESEVPTMPVEAEIADDATVEEKTEANLDGDNLETEDNQPPASPFQPAAGSPFRPAGENPFRRREAAPSRQSRSLPAFEPAARAGQTPVFTVFRPESGSGSFLGIGAVLFCAGVGLALIYKSFSHEPSLTQFFPLVIGPVLLALGAIFAYWTWGSISLRYVVDRNSLTIRWGAQRQVVPLVNIERLIPAAADGEDPDIRGVDWPGHHVGTARVQQLGEVLFYSGHRTTGDILYVQTPTETYGISVPDPVAFAEAIQANQLRGPLFEQRQAVLRDGIAAQSFWIDPQARFLTVVLLAAFVMVLGYVLQTYPDLSQSVPLRFPAIGGLLRVTDKSELLDIPRSAAAFLGLNLMLAIVLHPWERMVSIVLLLAGIAIQLALLIAAIVAVA